MVKAVILIGGPLKGTRFRPLSMDVPKPLFPVAGLPVIQHHIDACVKVSGLKEIIILGFYPAQEIKQFVQTMSKEHRIKIRYLQEYTALGTAGGMYHFRDQISSGQPEAFFILNGDTCADFCLSELYQFHKQRGDKALITMLGTDSTRSQATNFGCIVEDKGTHEVRHFVEKPSTFVSSLINCGVYVCSLKVFNKIADIFNKRQEDYYIEGNGSQEAISLEQDLLIPLAGTGQLFVHHSNRWWSQIKTAGSAIYANRHYLQLFRERYPERLAGSKGNDGQPNIIGDVFIHPTAIVDSSATLGPNVSVGPNVTIGRGVRIRESIILGAASIAEHTLVLYSIIGWNSMVGPWSRIEGTPCDPNPNKPFAKMDNAPLFNSDGRLNPSITILGCNVQVPGEVIILNSIVLPHKDLGHSFKNEIIL